MPFSPTLPFDHGCDAGPFDAVVKILGLARRERIDEARRAAGAARIDAHAGVLVRHPFLRIDDFPALVEIAGAGGDIRMLFRHALPGARIAVLEGKPLGIGAVAQDHRIAAFGDGPEHVGAKNKAVVHGDRHVPVDAHAVAGFAALLRASCGRLRPPPCGLRLPAMTCVFLRGFTRSRHGRDRPGHPRLLRRMRLKTWMPGTSLQLGRPKGRTRVAGHDVK